jgi:Lrp/AsnC family transcriptional regulator, leucine-responsive regulatory protein
MDQKDRIILDLLQSDAKLPQAEIARRVGLSPATVNERIKKLEQQGVIRKYVALLDDAGVGNDITAFIEVFIEHPSHERTFSDLMGELAEVQECHFVTGEFSCMLKVKVPDRTGLRELVLDRINALPGIRQTKTLIVLQTVKEDTRLPLQGDLPPTGTRTRT